MKGKPPVLKSDSNKRNRYSIMTLTISSCFPHLRSSSNPAAVCDFEEADIMPAKNVFIGQLWAEYISLIQETDTTIR